MITNRLDLLATWYGTDKGPHEHSYTSHYQRYLRPRRRQPLTVLEVGVGGDLNPNTGGASLRMWRTYLPKARIVGVDVRPKRLPVEQRITILEGDQSDPSSLQRIAERHGPFDLIVDDGSHRGDHITLTFETLWPHLNPRGLYVIEDLGTAYRPGYGGGPPGTPGTSIALLKDLIDSTQNGDVSAVHVYPGIAFVEKDLLLRDGLKPSADSDSRGRA